MVFCGSLKTPCLARWAGNSTTYSAPERQTHGTVAHVCIRARKRGGNDMFKELEMKRWLLMCAPLCLTGVLYAQDLETVRRSAAELAAAEASFAEQARRAKADATNAQMLAEKNLNEETAAKRDYDVKKGLLAKATAKVSSARTALDASATAVKTAEDAHFQSVLDLNSAEIKRDDAIVLKVTARNAHAANPTDVDLKNAFEAADKAAAEAEATYDALKLKAKGLFEAVDKAKAEKITREKALQDAQTAEDTAQKAADAAHAFIGVKGAAREAAVNAKASAEERLKTAEESLAAIRLELANRRLLVQYADRVDALEKKNLVTQAELQKAQEALKKEISSAQKTAMDPITQAVGRLEQEQRALRTDVNAATTLARNTDAKVGREVERLDENNRRMVGAFNAQNDKLRQLMKNDEDLNAKLDREVKRLDATDARHAERLTVISEEQGMLGEEVDALEGKVGTIEKNLGVARTDLDAIMHQFKSFRSNYPQHAQQAAKALNRAESTRQSGTIRQVQETTRELHSFYQLHVPSGRHCIMRNGRCYNSY